MQTDHSLKTFQLTTTEKDTVYIYNFEKNGGVFNTVRLILEKLNWRKIITGDKPVYIKLNLSSANPQVLHYANTDKEVLQSLLKIITSVTHNIFLVESDLARGDKQSGLYGGGTADDMFVLNGIDKMARKFSVKTMNLSKQEQAYNLDPLFDDFGLPKCLLEKNKTFITLPLIKTHALTAFTGALKNQWGCVPRWDRVLLHKNLNELLVLCNKLIKPDLVLMGGKYAMEGRGPTNGNPREFPIIMGSQKPASIDAVAMSLVDIDLSDADHVKSADSDLLGSTNAKKIEIIGEFEENRVEFEKAKLDWVLRLVNFLNRYKIFVYKVMMNQSLFDAVKKMVNFLRKIGIVR